ncbi:translocation/assembly module TamB domain-containing protein [Paracraurococcus lichenis]|uniref:Translocation/assembly module TamB domain-containing protein n=1 Tax=Paracraurococcus lichenis TaxID=3064888 RepID=A0ABT9DWN7_9PROT|nr:translocation/assembly module TamB domain-containing protein [Paracraurococcus sp. LOR1-02]MDO9708210.1 translocation/assembly module TamB domain-containing protein [Paracraurococcus sp. LOR1-02]
MRRAVRWLLGILLALILLPVLAVGAGLVWLNSAGGRATVARLAGEQVPGLTIEGLTGPIPGHLGAARITMADKEGVWLTVEEARIDLDLLALATRTLRIERVEAARIALPRLPASDPAAPAAPEPPSDKVLPQLPSLPVAVALERLAVGRLEIGAPILQQDAAFSVAGQAALQAGALRATLALHRLDAEGGADLALSLAPAEDRLSAKLALREGPGGIGPTLAGLKDQPLSLDLVLEGPAAGAALDLTAALGPEIGATLGGTVRARPDGALGATLKGTARAGPLLPPAAAPLAVPASLALDADLGADQRLALRDLTVEVPAGRLAAQGSADLGSEALDLRATLALAGADRFGALLPAGLGWDSVRAEAAIGGTLGKPSIDLTLVPEGLKTPVPQADAVLGPAPRLAVKAALPGPSLDATLDGAEGKLTATGTLAEPIALDARLSLPRLAVLGGGSEGALEARVQASGRLADPDLVVTAESGRIAAAGHVLESLSLKADIATPASAPRGTATLDGRLDGLPLALAFRGRPEGSAVEVEQGEARLGPARLEATGRLDPAGPVFDGTAKLEATDLAPLGRLGGVTGLAGRLSLDATLAPRDGQQGFEAKLDAPRLGYNGTEGSLQATAAGTPAALDWTLKGKATEGAISGRGHVEQQNGGWRLDLAALEAQAMGEAVRLAAPTRVTLGGDGGIALAPTALAIARGGRIEARGTWGPERADITASIAALPLALAERFAPDIKPQGTINADLRATGPVARPEIRATLTGTGLGAGADWAKGLPALTLRAEGSLAGEAVQLRADLDAGAAGKLAATARLPGGFGPRGPLAATLDGGLNLQPLAAPFLAAGADRVTGRLTLALRAEGTVGEPRLGGRATLSGAEYRNTALGLRVFDLNGTVTGEGTRLVVDRIAGRTAGNGTLELRGSVDAGAPGFPADLTLTARNARPVVSDLLTATFGADLRVQGPLTGGGSVAGTVRIQHAEIRVPTSLPASVPTLDNVRQRGRLPPGVIPPAPPKPPAPPAPPLNLAVTVSAPREIFIRGRGIDVELGGEVKVGGTAAAPVPSGTLNLLRGTLDLVGRPLTFQRGTISFAAGTMLPQLDLTAQSQASSTTILVNVAGSPTAPKVTFTSTPELPQDEVLARLLFDRPTSNLSPFEIAQIAAAVAQLTGVGGGVANPLDKVRGLLGLDRLGVTSGAQQQSSTPGQTASTTGGQQGPTVEAGRYVAPGVFLGVRQGTQGGQTGVGVQVEITPRLKLEGQTATGPAGDRLGLSYEFEY